MLEDFSKFCAFHAASSALVTVLRLHQSIESTRRLNINDKMNQTVAVPPLPNLSPPLPTLPLPSLSSGAKQHQKFCAVSQMSHASNLLQGD